MQGYLGATGYELSLSGDRVTARGRGVMALAATGDTTNPSAGYAPIDANVGIGTMERSQRKEPVPRLTTASPVTKRRSRNPPRTRWGDFGAAAVDQTLSGSPASTSPHPCDYTTWGGRFFGATTGDNRTFAPSTGHLSSLASGII